VGREGFYVTERAFFLCAAVLNMRNMSKSHGRMWGNPFWAVRGQTLFPWTWNLNAGCALVNLSADMVHGLCTSWDERGRTQMPVHHSHCSERVLLGSYNTLGFLFLTSQQSVLGGSLHRTGCGNHRITES